MIPTDSLTERTRWSASETTLEASKPFWRGHGLWRVPNFFRSVYVDAPRLGLATAGAMHFRRLTIEQAARQLPTVGTRPGDPLAVYFMSGRDHWAMTAFCAFTLLSSTEANVAPVIMDDGSLEMVHRTKLKHILPSVQFWERNDCEMRVSRILPESKFPALHAMRRHLPLMAKLIDLHAGLAGARLFLDSDVLFLKEPDWMIRWLRIPSRPVYMLDYQNSYGYPPELLDETLGQPMPEKVNTGFCGLIAEKIDWERVESWGRKLHDAGGTNHFSEQCLTAMLMATQGGEAAPREYLICPSEQESLKREAAMHHYVAESRAWYYIHGWPGVLRRLGR